jgi:hypothetical protein
MVSSDLKLPERRFSTKDMRETSLIRFTITSGKIVLDPNIVLFKDVYLIALMDPSSANDFSPHSTEPVRFRVWNAGVLEDIILRFVFNKALGGTKFLRQLKKV